MMMMMMMMIDIATTLSSQ